jgi:molecular chaperone GrpE
MPTLPDGFAVPDASPRDLGPFPPRDRRMSEILDGPSDDALRDHVREHMSTDDTADMAVHAVDELADQAGALEQLRLDVASLNDQLLRRAAEFQNYRRRVEMQRADDERAARAATLAPLLDVFDDLRRSIDAARRAGSADTPDGAAASPAFDALSQGVELVYLKFENALAALGVERIESVGLPFNTAEHEAVMQQPAPNGEAPDTVLAEVQPGYRLGERVLRHARVIVAA